MHGNAKTYRDLERAMEVGVGRIVLDNDTDRDGPNALTASLESASAGAVVNVAADGTFTYVPAPFFVGTDTFDVRVSDGFGSVVETVTVDVVGPRIWYVREGFVGGNGTSAAPYDSPLSVFLEAGDLMYIEDTGTPYVTSGWQFGGDGIDVRGEAVGLSVDVALNGGANTVHFRETRCDYFDGTTLAGTPFSGYAELQDLAGYLWYSQYNNIGGYKILGGFGNIGSATNWFDLCHVTTVYGDFGLADEITLWSTGYAVLQFQGTVTPNTPVEHRTITGNMN